MKHELKTINPYFESVWNGVKAFEVRFNDREFKKGDDLILREYDPINNIYTGREVHGFITYVQIVYPAICDGYVVFSFFVDDIYDLKDE